MKQLFLHQVVKIQQWQVYKEIILNLSHHTCGSIDLQEESWFLFTLFQGFWGCWKQIHPLLWARSFQKTTRICSEVYSKLDDPEDVPLAQRSLSVQRSWHLLPPPIWDKEGGELGDGTEATPYPGNKLVLGNAVQGGCAVFHLLKATTVVRKWGKKNV